MCFRKNSRPLCKLAEKYISISGLVNIPDHATKMVSTPMFSGSNHARSDLMCCSKNSMQISAVITEKNILLVRSLNTPIVDN